jgi:hypothetical protein
VILQPRQDRILKDIDYEAGAEPPTPFTWFSIRQLVAIAGATSRITAFCLGKTGETPSVGNRLTAMLVS